MQSIETLKRQLRREGRPGIALDIDETLAATAECWFETMFARFGNPEALTAREMIAKYRYTENVPYWQTDEVHRWLESMRYNSDFQGAIPPIPEALDFVHLVAAVLPVRLYLTARPLALFACTREWLVRNRFPEAPVVLRPPGLAFEESAAWKARVLMYLHPEIEGIVDDNAEILSHLPHGYRGRVYLYSHAILPTAHACARACPTWPDIHREVSVR